MSKKTINLTNDNKTLEKEYAKELEKVLVVAAMRLVTDCDKKQLISFTKNRKLVKLMNKRRKELNKALHNEWTKENNK